VKTQVKEIKFLLLGSKADALVLAPESLGSAFSIN
jgi:hypothetical protein